MCNCNNVDIGSYSNQVELPRPKHMMGRGEGTQSDTICIDVCISDEVKQLWAQGISTTGCCCGHNKLKGFIGVIDTDTSKMKALGYEVQINTLRPADRDTFNLKNNN